MLAKQSLVFLLPSVFLLATSGLIYFLHRTIFKCHIFNTQTYWDTAEYDVSHIFPQSPTNNPLFRENFIWFIHVSDIHISYKVPQTKANLIKFVDEVLPAVSPYFVLATGDLTNAKNKVSFISGQIQEEWETYSDILTSRNIKPSFWFDIPGNHDRFNVADISADLYSVFGVQSKRKDILSSVNTNIGDINIISLDAR